MRDTKIKLATLQLTSLTCGILPYSNENHLILQSCFN